jgi:hypothetical protein
MTISIAQFFMGRDISYKSELTDEIRTNAAETVRRANLLLDKFQAAVPSAHVRGVNSGWRPPAVNANVPGAAKKSNHMIGKAVDLNDDDGELDAWLITQSGQDALVEIGLWMEHPDSTPRWSHVQTVPPGSGHRVFYP